MSTIYNSIYIPLTEGQKTKLARAIKNSNEVSLLIDKHQIKKKGNTELYLTERQITRYNKVKNEGKGITLSMSKTQINKMRTDMIGKGIQVTPQNQTPPNDQGGTGMQIEYPYYPPPFIGKRRSKGGKLVIDPLYRPPPVFGTWDDYHRQTGGLVIPKREIKKTLKKRH